MIQVSETLPIPSDGDVPWAVRRFVGSVGLTPREWLDAVVSLNLRERCQTSAIDREMSSTILMTDLEFARKHRGLGLILRFGSLKSRLEGDQPMDGLGL